MRLFSSPGRSILVCACFLLALTAALLGVRSVRWGLLKAKIRHDFPGVPRIQTGELAVWLADFHRAPPTLLDTREPREYAVSHLAGARLVPPKTDPQMLGLDPAQPIVTYCSVGARSSAYAAKLQAAGFQNVANLEGSVFQWANEGRPLVHENQPTTLVHPFNKLWGSMLEREHRAPAN